MTASFFYHIHLGDKVAICLALHSLAEHIGEKIKVRGCTEIRELVLGIGMSRLEWEEGTLVGTKTACLSDFFLFLEGSRIPFFTKPSISLDFEPLKMERAILPQNAPKTEKITLFQFDSRSQSEKKIKLSRKESINFLKKKAKFKAIGVGGFDTKKELPYEYELNDLEGIIKKMRSAGQFVGVDSGMSHIAGSLCVPSDIYLMHKEELDVKMVELFYKEFYPKTVCYHDFSENFRTPKLKIF